MKFSFKGEDDDTIIEVYVKNFVEIIARDDYSGKVVSYIILTKKEFNKICKEVRGKNE